MTQPHSDWTFCHEDEFNGLQFDQTTDNPFFSSALTNSYW
ncbi:hypothetical protein EV13_0972 [Prochlorococcus sp. MIT 0702]|nr:hypothetical protein EV12_0407 [Prochlorococcus sp. MIT 0701]KGG29753.1 hypothetical protein EV13_0972 [Prochlorococcus sp. MIT 0702]KGG34309.1 hypothetical protein EV14_1404 [Prochlorococcus sp. MIT 0703]